MKKKVKQIVFLIGMLVIMVSSITAAPHNGDIFNLKQPDGTTVPVRVYGDEYYQDVESLDGYTLVRDENTGWICYAGLSANGNNYESTGIIYDPDSMAYPESALINESGGRHLRINNEQIALQRKANFEALNGKTELEALQESALLREVAEEALESAPEAVEYVTGLTILVDFSDETSVIPQNAIDDFCNKVGYKGYDNYGSVRDYFYDVSSGKFVFKNVVTKYLRMPHPKNTYYDVVLGSGYGRTKQLVVDALKELEKTGFDFDQITSKNGVFVSINIFYAGSPNHGWAKGLWPHKSSLYGSNQYTAPNGIKALGYEMTPIRNELSIATFCHENGHLIFNWPDLYAYDRHSNGIGRFGLMCSNNSKYPTQPNPYFRYLEGWIDLVDITNARQGTVYTAYANAHSAYKYTGSGDELFLIENRAQKGWSTGLAGNGIVIWHINKKGSNINKSSDDYIAVEQADGLTEIERKIDMGDAQDFFYAGHNSTFTDTTSPNGKLHTGSNSGINIRNISAIGNTMTFSIGNTASSTPTPRPTQTSTPRPTSTPRVTPTAGTCSYPQWNPNSHYVENTIVHHAGHDWQAKWYANVGEEPGKTGEWGVWEDLGVCKGGSVVTPTATPTNKVTVTATPTRVAKTPTATPTTGTGYPEWKVDTTYTAGDIVKYNGDLYKALITHTAYSSSWNPPSAPTLWKAL